MFATTAQNFLSIELGMKLAIPAIVLRSLYQNSNSEFSLTSTEASWYGSILFLTQPIGSLASGIIQERFGNKNCMIFANIPSILGWNLLYFTHSVYSLYASISLMGLSIGLSTVTFSYVGEIAEPRLRGYMSSIVSLSSLFGLLLAFIMGYFVDWRTSALLCTLCPIICICLIFFIPESPIWLVAKGENEKAEKALCWLRGWVKPETVKFEFNELIHYNEVSGTQRDNNIDTNDEGLFLKLAQLKNPSVYRPLRLLMFYFFVCFLVNMTPARPFIYQIMTKVGMIKSQSLYLVIFAVLQNIAGVVLTLTINRLGKRFLSLLTLFVNSILLLLFGAYIVAMKNNYIRSTPWIPLTLICGLYFSGSCGVNSIPWMLICEIFPNKSRGIATGTCVGLTYLLLFTLTKSYFTVEYLLTLEYTVILFGCVGIIGFVYFYFYLPETENKTLLEIEKYFVSTD